MAAGLGDLEGQVLGGRYRLDKKIGQGGMGAVYSAMQTSLGRQVAVKVLLPMLSGDASLVARFRVEAERSGHLNHPHIVQILDFGKEDNGSVWIAMELLEGEPLTDRIARGPLSEADTVRFTKEGLAALEAAHAARLVHRDLKPDNIFLTKAAGVGEQVKILDFGIAKLLDGDSAAKLTATGLVIGTPLYMSSEQARGDDLDERSDLYSLGAVMYECLTGEPPFTGRNYNALLVAVLTQTARPITELRPDLSPELAAVVMRALEKDKDDRFASAGEMSAALDAFTPKTETPAPNAEMSMAATMATPGDGVALPAPGASAAAQSPVRSTNQAAEYVPAHGATEAAPVSQGPGPGPETEPMQAPKRARRRHGWLIPAMVAVSLLAGITGTATFMQTADAPMDTAVAVADPAAAMVPVTPVVPMPAATLGAAAPDEPAASPRGQLAIAPSGAEAPGHGTAADPNAALGETPDGEDAADRRTAKRPAMRRRPNVSIRVSGGAYPGYPERRQRLYTSAPWGECWPRNLPFPDVNRGLTIEAQASVDGSLSNFSVVGTNNYPTVATCLMDKLRGASVGPSDRGEANTVRVSFGLYEIRR
ncbi:MAG: protein kinase [Deltaproteobacteria bacterium]|nr:protein kinase [Deltaproteobacteria bacterium]